MLALVRKIILPIGIFFGFLLLYVHNLSPAVYSGDVGDLLTAAALGGVAHPPGYPLFTFIGFLLVHQPFIHQTPAFLVGLISAFSGALGLLCFYSIAYVFSKNKFTSLFATLVLGFSFLYWFYSEIAEVFALNVFFSLLLFLLALLVRKTKKPHVILLFFFILGLSLTNHQTILLLIPPLLILTAPTIVRHIKKYPFFILPCLFFVLLGFTPYVYVWIASSHHPLINWDNVHDLPSLLHLMLRKDYGTFQAGIFPQISFWQRVVTLKIFLTYLIGQLTITVVVLSAVGFGVLFRRDKLFFFSLLFAFILTGPTFLVYAGFPLTSAFILGTYERFVVLPLALFLIPLSVGLQVSVSFLARFLPKRHYEAIFISVFFLIPLMLCLYNFPKTNLSNFFLGNTYAIDYIATLPKNAILLITGDTQTFNLWYVHYVLHIRPDVLVYNLGATPIQDSIISPRLQGIPESKRADYLVSILENLQHTYPVFSNVKMQPKKGPKITWVPYGLSYQMLPETNLPTKDIFIHQTDNIWKTLHVPTKQQLQQDVFHNLSIAEIPTYYSDMLVSTGAFVYSSYKDADTALALYKKAQDIAPDNPRTYADRAVVLMGKMGKCQEIIADLSQAVSLDPYKEIPYFLLYNISQTCVKQKSTADVIAKEYTAIFKKDFQKEYKKFGMNTSLYE